MSEYTGSALYLLWKGTALQAHFRTFTPDETAGFEDASAGSDTHRTYLGTLIDGGASLTMVAQDTTGAGSGLWASLAPNSAAGTLEWGPQGTAVGQLRRYVTAILTKRSETINYAGVTEWNIEWKYSDSDGPTQTSY